MHASEHGVVWNRPLFLMNLCGNTVMSTRSNSKILNKTKTANNYTVSTVGIRCRLESRATLIWQKCVRVWRNASYPILAPSPLATLSPAEAVTETGWIFDSTHPFSIIASPAACCGEVYNHSHTCVHFFCPLVSPNVPVWRSLVKAEVLGENHCRYEHSAPRFFFFPFYWFL